MKDVTQPSPVAKDLLAQIQLATEKLKNGYLTYAADLKKCLVQAGLFDERSYNKLLSDARSAFHRRTAPEFDRQIREIESLPEFQVKNEEYLTLLRRRVYQILCAKSPEEAFERISYLRAFLAEFYFDSEVLLKRLLGETIYKSYVEQRDARKRPGK